MSPTIFVLKSLRKLYTTYHKTERWAKEYICKQQFDPYEEQLYEKLVELFDQEANDYCRELLATGKPCMIAKFGTIELNALIQHKSCQQSDYQLSEYIQFIKNKRPTLWWNEGIDTLCSNAGFFPNETKLLEHFYAINLAAMKQIDVLGSYIEGELFFKEDLKQTKKINIDGYYAPFYFKNPWTKVLEGKRILVIHPFEKSIRCQYQHRELIWEDKDLLPAFELITIKAEQTMLGQSSEYANWFEALESMKQKMQETDFDIALIGAGAYGMPLAAYAKKLGKQAVHLGGWTQVLFGIKGKRWVDMPLVVKYMNEYWIKPLPDEVPQNFIKVEDGCYW
jgi:hypothetical protein